MLGKAIGVKKLKLKPKILQHAWFIYFILFYLLYFCVYLLYFKHELYVYRHFIKVKT